MYFNEVILLNQSISLNEAEKHFQNSYLDFKVLSLWDEPFIYNSLLNLRKQEYDQLFTKNKNQQNLKSLEQEVKINCTDIGFLVSMLSHLNLEKEVEKELLITYYDGLEQRKRTTFMENLITLNNKPNLVSYLITHGYTIELTEKENIKVMSRIKKEKYQKKL